MVVIFYFIPIINVSLGLHACIHFLFGQTIISGEVKDVKAISTGAEPAVDTTVYFIYYISPFSQSFYHLSSLTLPQSWAWGINANNPYAALEGSD